MPQPTLKHSPADLWLRRHNARVRERKVGIFVRTLGSVAEDRKADGKIGRHPELLAVALGQIDAYPLTKGGRDFANVDGDIEHGNAQQLALELLQLMMQAAQHPLSAAAVVV